MAQPRDEVQVPLYEYGYGAADDYEIEPGVCVLPIAEEPPESPGQLQGWSPVVILRLHAPYRVRRMTTGAKKTNNPPVLPAPADSGAFVFVDGVIHFEKTLNAGLNAFDWHVGCTYTFVEVCPSRNQDGFVLTAAPWTWTSAQINSNTFGVNPAVPPIGAIGYAGADSKIGYAQGASCTDGLGNLKFVYTYNTSTFFPGVFLSSDIVNGGPQNQNVSPPTPNNTP